MSDSQQNALLIFVKNPKKGHVKTRLAAGVGQDKALSIYHKLLDYTREVALQASADKILWYSKAVKKDDEWDSEAFIKKEQQGETLGERMKYAFKQAFDEGYEKVVIIGSDCGQLKPKHIKQAYLTLKYHDVVIGPSQDGGYYLLGLSKFLPALFEDKPWSTDQVFTQTVKDCKQHDWRYHALEELNDVDTEADWQQVEDQF